MKELSLFRDIWRVEGQNCEERGRGGNLLLVNKKVQNLEELESNTGPAWAAPGTGKNRKET